MPIIFKDTTTNHINRIATSYSVPELNDYLTEAIKHAKQSTAPENVPQLARIWQRMEEVKGLGVEKGGLLLKSMYAITVLCCSSSFFDLACVNMTPQDRLEANRACELIKPILDDYAVTSTSQPKREFETAVQIMNTIAQYTSRAVRRS